MDESFRALIVDDEKNIRTTLSVCLEGQGCTVAQAASADQGLEAVSRQHYDIVFLDLQLGGTSGLDLLPKILAADPAARVVMI
ncbi:MAG TPA: response regulator, partial [Planctomycetota bacterium]|nr:response regulator [Planctomycetota bacterium]